MAGNPGFNAGGRGELFAPLAGGALAQASLVNPGPITETSIRVFRRFITKTQSPDGSYMYDASEVVGKECYEAWLNSRSEPPNEPEKVFQRSLTSHLTSSDGRQPFSPEEEEAVLKVIRCKRIWPAFEGTTVTIGCKGFRALGVHEKSSAVGAHSVLSELSGSKRSATAKDSDDAHSVKLVYHGGSNPLVLPDGGDADPLSRRGSESSKLASKPWEAAASHPSSAHWAARNSPTDDDFLSSLKDFDEMPRASASAAAAPKSMTQVLGTLLPTRAAAAVPKCVIAEPLPVDPRVAAAFNDGAMLFGAILQLISKGVSTLELFSGQPATALHTPSIVDALMAISKFEARHENFAVIALNLGTTKFNELYFAQNSLSVPFLGIVAKNLPSAAYRALIPELEVLHFIRHMFVCTRIAPGQDFVFSCNVNLLCGLRLLRLVMCYENGVLVVGGEV